MEHLVAFVHMLAPADDPLGAIYGLPAIFLVILL
jgi:hypothetical protein